MDELWNTTGDRTTLRKLYHDNAMLYNHFLSNQVRPIESQRKWEQLDSLALNHNEPTTYFEHLLTSRRTKRTVSGQPITLGFIARLLEFCIGVSGETDDGHKLFTYPSPGATYATTVFLTISEWEGNYLYRYNPYTHALEYFKKEVAHDLSDVIYDSELQTFPIKLFFASDYQLIEEKYGEMAYRLLMLEMGHMVQNILLYSFDSGCHSVSLGGYNEPLFKETASRDYDLHYVVVVG